MGLFQASPWSEKLEESLQSVSPRGNCAFACISLERMLSAVDREFEGWMEIQLILREGRKFAIGKYHEDKLVLACEESLAKERGMNSEPYEEWIWAIQSAEGLAAFFSGWRTGLAEDIYGGAAIAGDYPMGESDRQERDLQVNLIETLRQQSPLVAWDQFGKPVDSVALGKTLPPYVRAKKIFE